MTSKWAFHWLINVPRKDINIVIIIKPRRKHMQRSMNINLSHSLLLLIKHLILGSYPYKNELRPRSTDYHSWFRLSHSKKTRGPLVKYIFQKKHLLPAHTCRKELEVVYPYGIGWALFWGLEITWTSLAKSFDSIPLHLIMAISKL